MAFSGCLGKGSLEVKGIATQVQEIELKRLSHRYGGRGPQFGPQNSRLQANGIRRLHQSAIAYFAANQHSPPLRSPAPPDPTGGAPPITADGSHASSVYAIVGVDVSSSMPGLSKPKCQHLAPPFHISMRGFDAEAAREKLEGVPANGLSPDWARLPAERPKTSPEPLHEPKRANLCLANHEVECPFGWSRVEHKARVRFTIARRLIGSSLGQTLFVGGRSDLLFTFTVRHTA